MSVGRSVGRSVGLSATNELQMLIVARIFSCDSSSIGRNVCRLDGRLVGRLATIEFQKCISDRIFVGCDA